MRRIEATYAALLSVLTSSNQGVKSKAANVDAVALIID
ncbi:hypothetical protein LBUL87_0948 [Lactobacillus delbrueckii subsp. bulgaricus]|nr:hypothetical protein LBUL87_0931 [Lactobacillus delbrueckii subsp. bulgaricus]SNR19528.1 hypothetical protein LBUL87_0948 [Lactobacillus delbrueckii subsp. bulgaricus]